MRRALLLALLGSAILAPSAAADVDAYLQAHWPHGASGTVLVARGSHAIACRGLGQASPGRRATCDTVYDLMSMTKPITAAAILKLQMLGRLRYRYSNVGYSLLAAIVEHASGVSYEQVLRRELFLPTGMRHTGYVLPHWRRAEVAVEYDRHGRAQGRPFEHPWAPDGPYWNLRGNGGLLSTAHDMLRWYRALRGDRILSAAARRAYSTPRVRVGAGESAAYAGSVFRTPAGTVITHDGGNGWSFGLTARFVRSHTQVFWITNHVEQVGRRNLDASAQALTLGLATA